MPIYEYHCEDCQKSFENFQRVDDDSIPDCKLCKGNKVKKLLSPVGFVLKGSGFYTNDYPSESRKKAMESEKNAEKKPEPAKDAGKKALDSAKSTEKLSVAAK